MAADDWLEKLLREVDADIAAKKPRLENPYVRDLIEVLMQHPRGLSRQLVLHTLEKSESRSAYRSRRNLNSQSKAPTTNIASILRYS